MLANIPPPPAQNAALMTAAACVFIGVGLVLWGRSLGRILLAVVAAGIAAACSPVIALHMSYENIWIVGVAAAALAGGLAFVLARLIWAVALGAALSTLALGVFASLAAAKVAYKPLWEDYQLVTFGGWCVCLADYLGRWVRTLWAHNATITALAAAVPVFAALAIWAALPKTTVIVTSSLIGAAGVIGGVALSVWSRRPEWMVVWAKHAYVPVAAAGMLAAVGLFVQARTELQIAAETEEAEPGQQTGQDRQPVPGQAAEKPD
jgi:hypothetical protein